MAWTCRWPPLHSLALKCHTFRPNLQAWWANASCNTQHATVLHQLWPCDPHSRHTITGSCTFVPFCSSQHQGLYCHNPLPAPAYYAHIMPSSVNGNCTENEQIYSSMPTSVSCTSCPACATIPVIPCLRRDYAGLGQHRDCCTAE